jgi:hypothetical protein
LILERSYLISIATMSQKQRWRRCYDELEKIGRGVKGRGLQLAAQATHSL